MTYLTSNPHQICHNFLLLFGRNLIGVSENNNRNPFAIQKMHNVHGDVLESRKE
jgi:hypothetical protein